MKIRFCLNSVDTHVTHLEIRILETENTHKFTHARTYTIHNKTMCVRTHWDETREIANNMILTHVIFVRHGAYENRETRRCALCAVRVCECEFVFDFIIMIWYKINNFAQNKIAWVTWPISMWRTIRVKWSKCIYLYPMYGADDDLCYDDDVC